MTSRIVRSTFVVLLFSAFALQAEEQKHCNSSAQECEREIRRMLSGRRYLGWQVVELPHGGIVVKTVNIDGPADHAGFKEGDRIVAINGRDMTLASVRDFKQTLADAKETGGVLFVIIQRRGAYKKIDAKLEPYPKAQIDKIIAQHILQYHTSLPQSQNQTSSTQP